MRGGEGGRGSSEPFPVARDINHYFGFNAVRSSLAAKPYAMHPSASLAVSSPFYTLRYRGSAVDR